ncbi:Hypothetical predicted protein [Octopus vulgaris]|uniref:Uncharacterized protein n=1 Tax=Octopus vulgaris TaxID=6645 RepID=A0AA36BX73_OCTVU|nr:Hypothetical predicted protein [Octopus vulgaris]
MTTRHRAETEMETERLQTAKLQAERTLEVREHSHRQRVKGLEEQVSTLKDQLKQEIQKRQSYISRSVRTGDEIKDIRFLLDNSLSNVTRDSCLNPLLLEHETKKLDLMHKGVSPPVKLSPVRSHSPLRTGGAGHLHRNVTNSSFRHKVKK